MQRHAVKPGITGWAQVMYPYGASLGDAVEKLRYDLYYINNLFVWWMMRYCSTPVQPNISR